MSTPISIDSYFNLQSQTKHRTQACRTSDAVMDRLKSNVSTKRHAWTIWTTMDQLTVKWLWQKRKLNLAINRVRPIKAMQVRMVNQAASIMANRISECRMMIPARAVCSRTANNGSTKSISWHHNRRTQTQTARVQMPRTAAMMRINSDANQKTIKHLNHVPVHCVHAYTQMYQISDNICVSSTIQHRCAVPCARNRLPRICIWSVTICRCMAVRFQRKLSAAANQTIQMQRNYKQHNREHSHNHLKHSSR